jgi:hypothetical protein
VTRITPRRLVRALIAACGIAAVVALVIVLQHGPSATATASPPRTVLLLGSRAVAPLADSARAGRAEAFPFTAVRSGLAQSLHLYVDAPDRARSLSAAIYTDVGGHAAALLTRGTLGRPVPGRWNAISVRPEHVHAGARYWLAFVGRGGTLAFRDRPSSACGSEGTGPTVLLSLPASWHAGTRRATCSVSAYLTGRGASALAGSPGATGAPNPQRGCFSAPGACGYPDPAYANVGPSVPCSALAPSGPLTISSEGRRVHDLNVTGTITVRASNVTIDNVCVTADGGGQAGSAAVSIERGRNTLIENTTIAGANPSDRSVQIAVRNASGAIATLSHDYLYNCGECIHETPWAVSDSYVVSNGMQHTSDHIEALYCSDGSLSLVHDTLLNPNSQTAVVFCDTNGGSGGPCDNHLTLSNSLLAGGGYVLYACANASGPGTSTASVTANHFARCIAAPVTFDAASGGHACRGATSASTGSGADSHGYWPAAGYFGVATHTWCSAAAGRRWSGNVWDDDGASVSC